MFLQLAIVAGLYQQSTEIQPICPSGNCEFPDCVTLCFCSYCKDVTARVKQSCPDSPNPIFLRRGVKFSNYCLYETPNGLLYNSSSIADEVACGRTIWGGPKPDTWDCARSPGWNPIVMTAWEYSRVKLSNKTIFGIQSRILQYFAADYLNPTIWNTGDGLRREVPPEITECALYACERQ